MTIPLSKNQNSIILIQILKQKTELNFLKNVNSTTVNVHKTCFFLTKKVDALSKNVYKHNH